MSIARAPGPGENGLFGGDRPLPNELMTVSKTGYEALLARVIAVEMERDQLMLELNQLRNQAQASVDPLPMMFEQRSFDDSSDDFITGHI